MHQVVTPSHVPDYESLRHTIDQLQHTVELLTWRTETTMLNAQKLDETTKQHADEISVFQQQLSDCEKSVNGQAHANNSTKDVLHSTDTIGLRLEERLCALEAWKNESALAKPVTPQPWEQMIVEHQQSQEGLLMKHQQSQQDALKEHQQSQQELHQQIMDMRHKITNQEAELAHMKHKLETNLQQRGEFANDKPSDLTKDLEIVAESSAAPAMASHVYEEEIDKIEYSLDASIWDATIIVFTKNLSFSSSVYVSIVLLINISVQAYFCTILLTSDQFQYSRKFDDILPYAKRWRVEDGHQANYLGAVDMSLTTRVCNLDASLAIAYQQVKWLEEINTYLSLDVHELTQHRLAHGPILSMLCIGMFVLIVIDEVRGATGLSVALAMLRGERTMIKQRCVVSISFVRLICCWALNGMRILIASLLLYSGISWISSTSSIVEVILNAMSLGFVIEVDEMLFSSLLPQRVTQLMRDLQPLQLPLVPHYLDGILPMTFCIAILAVTFLHYINPNNEDMIALKQEMCGGHLNFIVHRDNDLGMVMSRESGNFTFPDLYSETQIGRAVSELKTAKFEVWAYNLYDAQYTAQHSVYFAHLTTDFYRWAFKGLVVTDALNPRCNDWDVFTSLGAWFNAVADLNKAKGKYGSDLAPIPLNCSNFFHLCNEDYNFVLRLICPRTCGCDDIASGLYFSGTVVGCPASCAQLARDKFESSNCVDVNLMSSTENASWNRYWQGWGPAERPYYTPDRPHYTEFWSDMDAFLKNVKTGGCGYAVGMRGLTKAGWDPCFQTEVMQEFGQNPIVGFCPATCCQTYNVTKQCPSRCKTRQGKR